MPGTASLLVSVGKRGWKLLPCRMQGEGTLESRVMVASAAVAESVEDRSPVDVFWPSPESTMWSVALRSAWAMMMEQDRVGVVASGVV